MKEMQPSENGEDAVEGSRRRERQMSAVQCKKNVGLAMLKARKCRRSFKCLGRRHTASRV